MKERSIALVGLDVGTSAAKAVACTPAGTLLAAAARGYTLRLPQPGYVELDADEVLAGAAAALREVLGSLDERQVGVAGLGLSGAMHGIVPVDASGAALGLCIPWLDRRSAAIAAQWQRDGSAGDLYLRTGAPVHPMLPSCKLRWLAEHQPEIAGRAAKFVSLKELLVFRWCGTWLIDWGLASATGLFDLRARAWYTPALALAGVAEERLSRPAAPSTRLSLCEAIARDLRLPPETLIVLGSSDGALANVGVGATGADDFALTLGTSGALRVVAPAPVLDPGARTFCYAADDTNYIIGGATSSAGAVLTRWEDWLLADISAAERHLRGLTLARSATPGARGLTLAPFLSGERAPYWRVDLHGTLAGLDLAHERADLLRAAYEGIVFALRSVYDVMLGHFAPPGRLRLSGGLAREPFVRQLIADIFNRETVLIERADASAFGAALMAGMALDIMPDVPNRMPSAQQPTSYASDEACETPNAPDTSNVERYAAAYARYQAVVAANLVR